ncbi:YdcF family protein [Rhizobium sp. 18065]|uniref:YdcF family protein n=1 Tax=Rhizobium sp. 18065 TaxID=2681411 RepID=UPI00135C7D37|nr:YdcF family protein [Rhizobium sp. 18065]
MFVVSKLFWMAAQPLSLAFLFVAVALLALIFHGRKTAMSALVASLLILFLTLYTTLGSYALQGLEARFPRPSGDPEALTCMIVLGGAFETEVTTQRGGIEFNQAAERFIEALRLAERFPQSKIFVSGGDGSLSGRYEGDAVASERFFATFGVAPERLIGEPASRTTFENVENSGSLLEQRGLRNCLLITSAFHMPRSIGLFRKAGIDVVPWPVDFRTSGIVTPALDFTQPTLNAQQMATAVREGIGLAAYYVLGRTSALYPAP